MILKKKSKKVPFLIFVSTYNIAQFLKIASLEFKIFHFLFFSQKMFNRNKNKKYNYSNADKR
jgi:hypothetical protein